VRTRSGTDTHMTHLDGTRLLGPADVAFLHDGLYPGPDGYRLIADRFGAIAGTDLVDYLSTR